MRRCSFFIGLMFLIFATSFSHGANPDEVLKNSDLEERAREISKIVRCVVCQNQNIDDSEAEVARDLRLLIRERLLQGESNQEIYDFLVSKYGEFILLQPRLQLNTILLWGLPIIILLFGSVGFWLFLKKSSRQSFVPLSDEEQQALDEILNKK